MSGTSTHTALRKANRQPVVPDAAVWAARGHAAMVVPVDGPSVLITDYFDDHQGRVQVDDVRGEMTLCAGYFSSDGQVRVVWGLHPQNPCA